MTTHFVLVVALLFAAVFAIESNLQPGGSGLRQRSLLAWIGTDNWPAKVGAILLIIGVGALVRYALMHFDAPDHLKLASGIVLSGAAGAAAWACRTDPKHRALHFALAGASLGIAYLCAYASLSLFRYVDDLAGIALLLTVAISAAVYAANVRSVSIAVLSMVGAYAAPAFAVTPKGPLLVMGYYALVSLLALALVLVRSWRPLIHLSFLFTLGGGLFFGWTQAFYRPEHFEVMLPMILLLVAIHLAMPLAEQRATRDTWVVRLDLGYFALLPVAAAAAMWSIAPHIKPDAVNGFALLGALWMVAAVFAWRFRRDATTFHALVGGAFLVTALLMHFRNLSWSLIGLLASTAILLASRRVKALEGARTIGGVLALLCAVALVFDGGRPALMGTPFANALTMENLLISASLIAGGWAILSTHRGLGSTMSIAGALWMAATVTRELLRLELPDLPQWIHAGVLVALLGAAFAPVPRERRETALALALAATVLTSAWSAASASTLVAIALGGASLSVLFLIFRHRVSAERGAGKTIPLEAFAVPFVAALWASAVDQSAGAPGNHLVVATTAAAMIVIVLIARLHSWRQDAFNDFLLPATFIGAALLLGIDLLFRIEPGTLPVVAELVLFAFLGIVTAGIPDRERAKTPMIVVVVFFALLVQAAVLRAFGPPGTLTALDVLRIGWPAVISLLWAIMGATLAWASQRLASRAVWSAGSILLVASAVKLVLFDFGSLGELENILAVIAAGGVFFVVARLAPLPPKAPEPPPRAVAGKKESANRTEPAVSSPTCNPVSTSPRMPVPVVQNPPAPKANIDIPEQKPSPRRGEARPQLDPDDKPSVWSLSRLLIYLVIAVLVFFSIRSCLPQPRKTIPAAQMPSNKASPSAPAPAPVAAPAAAPFALPAPPTQPSASRPKVTTECTQFVERLPAGFVLYAAGDYKGRPLGLYFENSQHQATQFSVRVHEPSAPVVIALGAYEPSIWKVDITPETRLAGVFISGYHGQRIEGLGNNVPVLNSTYDNRGSCGYFYLDKHDASKAEATLKRIFGRGAAEYFGANNGEVSIYGHGSRPQARKDVETGMPTVRGGLDGLRDLMDQGKLRHAFDSEISLAGLHGAGADVNPRMRGRTYVITSALTLPPGLYGAAAVTFIVERGVPWPKGDPGHSRIIDLNSIR